MTVVDSQTLVDASQRFLDGVERGDVDGLMEVITPLAHPGLEFTSVIGSEIDGRTYTGLDGIREWFEDLTETFAIEYRDRRITVHADGAIVVALYTIILRGKGSSVEIDREIGTVWELEDGLVVRGTTHPSQDEALKAAEAAGA